VRTTGADWLPLIERAGIEAGSPILLFCRRSFAGSWRCCDAAPPGRGLGPVVL